MLIGWFASGHGLSKSTITVKLMLSKVTVNFFRSGVSVGRSFYSAIQWINCCGLRKVGLAQPLRISEGNRTLWKARVRCWVSPEKQKKSTHLVIWPMFSILVTSKASPGRLQRVIRRVNSLSCVGSRSREQVTEAKQSRLEFAFK